ncbi:hypothetical protein [uncultured Herbaspirillum sp.]|uniref:hypothetical protein n=1 Tax=uncultured Herbaspirillum sp. TaxID=160236 RepID=UPI002582CCBB|nr:hypothetical protein [uncultured Herbaspirillum sp.]
MTPPSAGPAESDMPQQMPLRSLLAEISALTLHVQQLSRMAGEASALIDNSQMPAPIDPVSLQQAQQDAADHADDLDQTAPQVQWVELEEAIMRIFDQTFGPRLDTLERQMSMSLIAEIGPAAFVQKVLWGEEISDIALTIALERMLPALEQLVEVHPRAFLHQANSVLGRFKSN